MNSLAVKKGLTKVSIREDKIQVVYNGVDIFKFREAKTKDLRGRYGCSPKAVLIGYIGQINPKKGITDFIEAAGFILQKDSNCRFFIFGKVPLGGNGLPKEIANLINARHLQNHVIFSGWEEKIETVYKALDIVVVPSRHEDPAPNVNIEAMAGGVPVVATQVGGSTELIEDQVTGFLVPKQDVKELSDRILQLAQNPSLRSKMGEAGEKRVGQLFDLRKNAALIEEILFNESIL